MAILCDSNVIHSGIVTKLKLQMPKDDKMEALADFFKNYSDSTRVKILWILSMNEMCVCDISVLAKMTKSAISHQLKVLRLSNLIKSRKEGKVVYYSLVDDHISTILNNGLDHVSDCNL